MGRRCTDARSARVEPLEERKLLAWNAYAHLVGQDVAANVFPNITGKGETIALIDTGVDFNQADDQNAIWTNPDEIPGNGKDDDGDGYIDDVHGWDFYRNDPVPEDENGHGTQMTGLLAGREFTWGNETYRGVAPDAKVIELKVADPTGRISDLAFAQRIEQALKWVESNYKRFNIVAVNMSLRVPADAFAQTMADEVARLNQDGVFLAAAGGHFGNMPTLLWPAADPNVYSAGILNVDGTISSITQRGPDLDILAPGNGVLVPAKGGGHVISGEATSYSTPWLTATAALIKQVDPSFTPAQIMAMIKESGHDVKDPSPGGLTYRRLDIGEALKLATQRASHGPDPQPQPSPSPQPHKPHKPHKPPRLPKPQGKNGSAYPGGPFKATGIIEAEKFDVGKDGVAYHDASAGNTGGAFRTGGVDIAQASDRGGGYAVVDGRSGEWLDYTVVVPAGGMYRFVARLAAAKAGGTIRLSVDGQTVGTLKVPSTGGKDAWATASLKGVKLAAGKHLLRLSFLARTHTGTVVGGLNWFSFKRM